MRHILGCATYEEQDSHGNTEFRTCQVYGILHYPVTRLGGADCAVTGCNKSSLDTFTLLYS
jgi:hypothetical protein